MDKIELFISLNQSVADGMLIENIGSELVEAIIIGKDEIVANIVNKVSTSL